GEASQAATAAAAQAKKVDETFIMPGLQFLDAVDLTGTIAIDDLKVKEIEAKQLAAKVRATEGKLQVTGITADLYDGKLSGTLTASSSNEVTADVSLAKVSMGPLLQALVHEDRLT